MYGFPRQRLLEPLSELRLHQAGTLRTLARSLSPRVSRVLFASSPGARRARSQLIPRTIPESTIAALRALLVHMVRDEPSADSEGRARAGREVRLALRVLCDDARAHGVRVEQLVIAIKQGWSLLHSDHPRARSAGPDELLNHVVTLCIDEYLSLIHI